MLKYLRFFATRIEREILNITNSQTSFVIMKFVPSPRGDIPVAQLQAHRQQIHGGEKTKPSGDY